MKAGTSNNDLRNYNRLLSRSTHMFNCGPCKQRYTCKGYADHIYKMHNIPKFSTCPWYKCSIRGMTLDANHLKTCFERYLKASVLQSQTLESNEPSISRNEPSNEPSISRNEPSNEPNISRNEQIRNCSNLPLCKCIQFDPAHLKRNMLGRVRIPVRGKFYYSFCEKLYLQSEWFNPSDRPGNTSKNMLAIRNESIVFSQNSGLGAEGPMFIRKFIELEDSTTWHHIIVRASAFPQFYAAVKEERDHLGLLPFWCLCDGVSDPRGRSLKHIYHRHMIMVCSGNGEVFKRVWKNVKQTRQSFKYESYKTSKLIQTPHHLANVILYVGRENSNCKGTYDEMDQTLKAKEYDQTFKANEYDQTFKANKYNRHFYINRPVCEHSERYLCTLWPGGLQSHMQKLHGRKNVDKWYTEAEERENQWFVPSRVLDHGIFKCSVPYNRDFEPANIISLQHLNPETTAGYIFLLDDWVMTLKQNANLPTDGLDWYKYQMARGNCMNDVIDDQMYRLSKTQQNSMNQVVRACRSLKRDFKNQLRIQRTQFDDIFLQNYALQIIVKQLCIENENAAAEKKH